MAFGKVQKSTNSGESTKYIGLGSFKVAGVNMNKTQLESFYGTTLEKDPAYLTEREVDDKKVSTARITFYIEAPLVDEDGKIIKENVGLTESLKTNISFFLENRYNYNKDKTKVQIIDKYARTAWATVEQVKNKQVPVYSNGSANIATDYRPALVGEESLMQFLVAYLNIAPVMRFNDTTQQWTMTENPENSECQLDNIKDLFKGNFKELEEVCKLLPENRMKILFYIKDTDKGQFSQAYERVVLKNSARTMNAIEKDVKSRQEAGGLQNCTFDFNLIHKFEDTIKETPADELPFEVNDAAMPWDTPAA